MLLTNNQLLFTMIFKVKGLKAKGHPLVALFVHISSSNGYNNISMYDIV